VRQDVVIRPYRDEDERGWVLCRVLAFLDTAFFDDVRREKERYERDAVELVAESEGEIVGLIDVECESEPGTICEDRPDLGGMIWHLAVHPEHQRGGIATSLLTEAEIRARGKGIARFEAWTRDDLAARAWYEARGFELVQSYTQAYIELDEDLRDLFPVTADGLRPVRVFAHSVGNPDAMRARFRRVHETVLYERRLA
jgi:N-acetylglutamate synthase-like GNAT family acetyltransferase